MIYIIFKFFEKNKRIISRFLSITVTVMLLLSVVPISTQAAVSNDKIKILDIKEGGESGYSLNLTDSYNPEIRYFTRTRDHTITRIYYVDNDNVTLNVNDVDKCIYIDLYLADFFIDNYKLEVNVVFGFYINGSYKTFWCDSVTEAPNHFGDATYDWYRFKLSSASLSQLLFNGNAFNATFYGTYIYVYPAHVIRLLEVDSKSNGGAFVGGLYFEKDIGGNITEDEFEIPGFIDEEDEKWYSGFVEIIAKISTKVLGFIYDSLRFLISVLTDLLEPLFEYVAEVFQDCFDIFKPYLKELFDNSLLPLIQQILNSISRLVTAIVESFSPLLADIVNFFAPYFSEIITMVTSEIANLVNTLNPLVQEFVEAITPSFESLVTSLVDGITEVVEALFVPTETSSEDFEYFKTQLKEKIPIFDQLKSFLTVLFNPLSYDNLQQYTVTIKEMTEKQKKEYLSDWSIYSQYSEYYMFENNGVWIPDLMIEGKEYTISFNLELLEPRTKILLHLPSYDFNDLNYNALKEGYHSYTFIKNDFPMMTFELCETQDWDNYGEYIWNCASITDITITFPPEQVETVVGTLSAVSSDFIVEVYDKKVSVLDMSWYLPYKQYGDICVIAFCYLAFIWGLFKKLPSMV